MNIALAATGAPSDAEIYERIVAAVLEHRLAPGTKLVEDKLGQAFGVSRTRIRQALIRLAHEQIVTLIPNRGASVARPSETEAREVFGVRRLVEPPLVEAFVAAASLADLDELERAIRDEERAHGIGDRRAAIRLSGQFHLLIAERSGNRTLARVLRELVSRTSLILMTYDVPAPTDVRLGGGCACDDHRALLAAIRLRDAPAAVRSMRQHLALIEKRLDFEVAEPVRVDLVALFGGR
jgi:DNA-binding GntR family transcriptional regulator